jgi:hypothetical protein
LRHFIMALAFVLGLSITAPAWSGNSAHDGAIFSNISATTASFHLDGGKYGVDVVATFGGGSVKLQKLAADGTTYVSVGSTTDFSAAGYAAVDLAVGTYRFTIATASAIYAEVQPVEY